jgi:hypothetical protein
MGQQVLQVWSMASFNLLDVWYAYQARLCHLDKKATLQPLVVIMTLKVRIYSSLTLNALMMLATMCFFTLSRLLSKSATGMLVTSCGSRASDQLA